MSLERFKTQVLLLHSEQSTLDNLSTGFNERYTVHCATSGSEALNTLVETPIHVIVTAQELPGMSGLEALREAKKRSPDTIGILLAGSAGDELEALVGAKEVFQVVRGGVTPESLRSLIDGATQQARLLALAESANDTTANVDEPTSEHIVLETSENGSAIISDGTGRMPALDPAKISAAANVGARGVDVLVLTKDDEFLATVKDSARGLHNVHYANTIAQADDAVRKGHVGVAVVDAAMVGSDVEKMTLHLRAASPRLVSIVAGRRDDGEMLMDLINRGKVYRFLLKPVSPGRARLAIEASVKHHLEAPDSAFKKASIFSKAKPAAAPAPKPKPKPKPKTTPKPKASPAAKAKPARKLKPTPKPVVAKPADAPANVLPKINVEPRPVPKAKAKAPPARKKAGRGSVLVALTKSAQSAAASAAGGSLFTNPKLLGIGAAAIIAAVAVGWSLLSGTDEPATESSLVSDTAPAPGNPEIPPPPPPNIDAELEDARRAAAAGNIFNPPGNNAIEFYRAAAAKVPDDERVAAGFEASIEQALRMAEAAMLEQRFAEAEEVLEQVARADPRNARLPFLNAQLDQIRLGGILEDARAAIREARLDDAAAALSDARALGVKGPTDIDMVAEELSIALNDQRVAEMVASANERLNDGKLLAPANDNARYFFEHALSLDPQSAAAREGLVVIVSRLAAQVSEHIDDGDFPAADTVLADARRIDPASSELADVAANLQAARDRVEQERLAAIRRAAEEKAAAERAAAEKAAAEKAAAIKAAAEKAAAERAAALKAAAEKAAAEKAAAERAAAAKRAAEKAAAEKAAAEILAAERAAAEKVAADRRAAEKLAAQNAARTAHLTIQAGASSPKPVARRNTTNSSAAQKPPVETTVQKPAPQQSGAVGGQTSNTAGSRPAVVETDVTSATGTATGNSPVLVSSLNRIKYVAPKYPRTAQRRNISGWVDVDFTVDIDGTVKDIDVRDSNPGDTFVNSAVAAVEDWQFEPVFKNGVAIEQRAAIRMMFAIE